MPGMLRKDRNSIHAASFSSARKSTKQKNGSVGRVTFCFPGRGGGGGGGTILHKPYKYVWPQRVWFLSRLGLKTGIHFAHFGMESGILFQ